MADLLDQGAAFLDAQRDAHMTRTVTYRRGIEGTPLAATIGRSEFEQTDESGLIHQVESRDFIVRRADLVIGGVLSLPKAGDRIDEPDGSLTQVYEVVSIGIEPPYRFGDPSRRTLRIHTKHVSTEGA